jgi:hypothetical protein
MGMDVIEDEVWLPGLKKVVLLSIMHVGRKSVLNKDAFGAVIANRCLSPPRKIAPPFWKNKLPSH